MARPKSDQPTDGELEILNLLWSAGPSELGALWEGLRERRGVAKTTVATMLGVMLEKRLVERRHGARGYVWSAAMSAQRAQRGLLRKLVDAAFDGSARKLVAHMIEDGQLSDGERAEIRRMLDESDEQVEGER